ncbi:hypothetical protein DQ04_02351070 [Trypanosoma grayi]|uniref:hypothetical protein n=1 Tax=Trypanosoma grayi TaxID=71804 RepID=UPI0004F462C0|nr:hypothetical protein DQ04_02351070 [Trypanosoma grayi]KEG11711.1 hypothetical protein DQ04_02351070 [Trypanosoma grayi]
METASADLGSPAATSSNAATLTYTVAPHPFGYQTLFAMLISASAAKACTSSGIMKGLWDTVWGTLEQRRVKWSQLAFARCFSRQLEALNGSVVASISCALLSYGQPQPGVLWVTTQGLYFRSRQEVINGDGDSTSGNKRGREYAEEIEEDKEWDDEETAIREVLPLRGIVSLLPSVALPTAEKGPPYVSGIPNPIVRPNALQVFTWPPKQIYQFVYMHKLTLMPPSASQRKPTDADSEGLLLQHEYDAIMKFPGELDAVTFCALTERLWEARLKALRLPHLREGVEYAAPH